MTTQYYVSVNTSQFHSAEPAHYGTSSTSGDDVELRMGDGSSVPTQRQVLLALEAFERWIMQNGLDGTDSGSDLPPNRG